MIVTEVKFLLLSLRFPPIYRADANVSVLYHLGPRLRFPVHRLEAEWGLAEHLAPQFLVSVNSQLDFNSNSLRL